jgi:dTDP-4-dehydrorhamnose reductase
MARILLTGRTGQVGHYLLRPLASLGDVIAPDRSQLDFTQNDTIRTTIRTVRPEIIVNAAGATIVDQAEREPDITMQVNGIAPGILAEEARLCDALLLHFSTTFVFDGTKREPYVEDDVPNPINLYGRSKLAGERAIAAVGGDYLIFRASWTYSDLRSNFPRALLKLAREKEELDVVDDQVASPTWARAYADATAQVLRQADRIRAHRGIYHLSSAGKTTRLQWATKIIELARRYEERPAGWAHLRPIASSQYPHTAARPLYTVVDNSKIISAFGIRMSRWEHQLEDFIREWAAQRSGGLG